MVMIEILLFFLYALMYLTLAVFVVGILYVCYLVLAVCWLLLFDRKRLRAAYLAALAAQGSQSTKA
jgi:hypothetical protein